MSDGVTFLTLIVGFGFVIAAGAYIGAGPRQSFFSGLFPAPGVRDWPNGVQEEDAPRFAVEHLDGLRHGHPVTVAATPIAADDPIDAPRAELIDLGSRRLDAPHG